MRLGRICGTLFLLASAAAAADVHQQVVDLFTDAAAALSTWNPAGTISEGNVVGFLKCFDPAMPGYERLQADVQALLRQATVLTSIEFLSDEGDKQRRTVQLDWFMQIHDNSDASVVRRRETVKCTLEQRKKHWRITSFEPLSLFAPLRP